MNNMVGRYFPAYVFCLALGYGCSEESLDEEQELVQDKLKTADADCEGLGGEDLADCQQHKSKIAEVFTDAVEPSLICDYTWKCCWSSTSGGCTHSGTNKADCESSGQTSHCDGACTLSCPNGKGFCTCQPPML